MGINKILIPIAATIKADYIDANDQSLFSGNNLCLHFFPEDYTPEFTYGENTVTAGFSCFQVVNERPLFRVNLIVRDQRNTARLIIDRLIRRAKNNISQTNELIDDSLLSDYPNSTNYHKITIQDYLNIDYSDIATGYSTRNGTLSYSLIGGNINKGSTVYNAGLKLVFTQLS